MIFWGTMSLLPKKIPFKQSSIDDVKSLEDMKRVFKEYVKQIDDLYSKIRDNVENGGSETQNWSWREATALDVIDGKAKVKGNLIVLHKTSGKKHEFEA